MAIPITIRALRLPGATARRPWAKLHEDRSSGQ
jgi:hypothetical protein